MELDYEGFNNVAIFCPKDKDVEIAFSERNEEWRSPRLKWRLGKKHMVYTIRWRVSQDHNWNAILRTPNRRNATTHWKRCCKNTKFLTFQKVQRGTVTIYG